MAARSPLPNPLDRLHGVIDTIAAIATPPGRGGVGIVRVSGPKAREVATAILGQVPRPRHASLLDFRDSEGVVIDTGLGLFFPGPHSYTGEDVLELQGHGGPVVLDMVLTACVRAGCRLARPGEFTERAFLNDRLDLVQAEAIADLIDAGTAAAARSAQRALSGVFSAQVESLSLRLVQLRVHLEAAMDFPDEELDLFADEDIGRSLKTVIADLNAMLASARQGQLLREGAHLVIAGLPNAGKSSLLNRLVDREAAIVTDIPGTTRDLLKEQLSLDGLPLHLVDTAGLRESHDPVEQEGIRRAWKEMSQADLVLLVVDAVQGETPQVDAIKQRLPANLPVIRVFNKIDCLPQASTPSASDDCVQVSALTGQGIDRLREVLKKRFFFEGHVEGMFTARRRHIEALEQTQQHLELAWLRFEQAKAPELLAEELRLAHLALCEITGKFTSEDLLGRIFSSFCIGK